MVIFMKQGLRINLKSKLIDEGTLIHSQISLDLICCRVLILEPRKRFNFMVIYVTLKSSQNAKL